MSKADVHQKLNRAYEITLSVKGRKSGKDIPRPIWFTHEGNTFYLLPNRGSETEWYKNLLANPMLKISINVVEIPAKGKLITDDNGVDDVVKRFKSKYGGDVKRYYTNFDVTVEVTF